LNIVIIVEGKNDRARLRRLLTGDVDILCTFGTPGPDQIDRLVRTVGDRELYIFTDNDASGRRIRGILRDAFPDAEHIYTRKGYPGVEHTPDEYLIQQLEKAGLEAYIIRPEDDALTRLLQQDP
jgi:toprim domain protein